MHRLFLFVLYAVILSGCTITEDQDDDLDVADEAVDVVHQSDEPEVEPCDTGLQKLHVDLRVPYEPTYEWFVTQTERIAHMDAALVIYESRVDEMYKSFTRTEDFLLWPMMQQGMFLSHHEFAMVELGTIGMMRNDLVEEYNAAAKRFDWTPYTGEPNLPEHEYHLLAIP